jgi:hypothetical protein
VKAKQGTSIFRSVLSNAISLGGGKNVMQSTGDDTVVAGSGAETIAALGAARDLIFGGASPLFYVALRGLPPCSAAAAAIRSLAARGRT